MVLCCVDLKNIISVRRAVVNYLDTSRWRSLVKELRDKFDSLGVDSRSVELRPVVLWCFSSMIMCK